MSVDVIHVLDQRSLQAADCAAFGLSRSGAGGLQSPLIFHDAVFQGISGAAIQVCKNCVGGSEVKVLVGIKRSVPVNQVDVTITRPVQPGYINCFRLMFET
ncbi:MAG: hypothetical protein DMF15_08755 [Verrucomicrobia bacterium]|nr:MAG: hypothetical protein DMF15_08755 [Verrucomicrobiota bacterium]